MVFSLLNFLVILNVFGGVLSSGSNGVSFDQNYKVTWGDSHFLSLNNGQEVKLSMDNSSGSGFASKMSYGSGLFNMRIKVPDRDSAGVVTAFYLISQGHDNHDELDFEFLGNKEGKPYTLQTNVYAQDEGGREQRIILWFDPTKDFHDYKILWNQHQIVFFVDKIPIRVYKNKSNIGVAYPSREPMQVEASLWDGESWATDGGKTKTNWIYAPFKAYFQGFDINGCQADQTSNIQNCFSTKYWWNWRKYSQLDSMQLRAYENLKQKYMNYDYCSDRNRYPVAPPECQN